MKIKEGLQEKYEEYVRINVDDGEYSKAIIEAGEQVGKALDEGKTPQEAIAAMDGRELTGYMAGAAIQAVCHFHERGEELRVAWNERYNVPKEQKGIVNPALMIQNDDGTLSNDIQPV